MARAVSVLVEGRERLVVLDFHSVGLDRLIENGFIHSDDEHVVGNGTFRLDFEAFPPKRGRPGSAPSRHRCAIGGSVTVAIGIGVAPKARTKSARRDSRVGANDARTKPFFGTRISRKGLSG